MSKSFYILDGTALVYRSYFAFIRNPLISSKGENTSAVFGFAASILKLINDEKPDYFVITFDCKEPTFRHKMYAEYKATRERMPDELAESLPRIDQVVDVLNIESIKMPGYEADDIMGTLAQKAYEEGYTVYLVTGDKDLMQLVNDRISWYNLRKSGQDNEILDAEGVRAKFGVMPDQIVDALSLMGDTSDNIPGVPGIGQKTAVKLLNTYGTFDKVYENLENIKQNSMREKLRENRELADLSKKLVTIDRNIPLELNIESFEVREPDTEKAGSLFRELEFTSLLKQLPETRVETKERERNYHTVMTGEGLKNLVTGLSANPFVFDLETTGLDTITAEIVGFSFSWSESEAYYLPVIAPDETITLTLQEMLDVLKPIFENSSAQICAHNAKYDIKVLDKYGLKVTGLTFDTMIVAHLIDPDNRQYGLDSLSLEHLDISKIPTTDLIGSGKDEINMSEVPLAQIAEYACEDADCTFQLWKKFAPLIKEQKLTKLFSEVEIPLIPVLTGMELTGISLDKKFLKSLSVKMHAMMEQLTKEIYDLAGEEFNIASPQQLGKILFEKLEIQKELGIKRVKKTKIGYSTNVAVLEQYKGHPLVERILEYRQHAKLLSTYIDALPELVHEKTGRIHTSFNQTVAATGRLSSANPNLQNIPIRTSKGREIRKAFLPRNDSWKMISADYSQIELRLMADMSGDANMREAFVNNEDIHTKTAAQIFGLNVNEVEPEMRYRAKAINFGILYGMSAYRLARDQGISNEEAQNFIDAYFAYYPGVNLYIANQIAGATERGYVETMFGRRRYLPKLHSKNKRERQNAMNIAINTPLQGTAAELIKVAMIRLSDELKKGGFEAKLLLQIHDELVLEAPEHEVDKVKQVVKNCMENTLDSFAGMKLSVPLVVDVKTGDNWYEAH